MSSACSDALITARASASVGHSYDNALVETANGVYTAELIYSKRIWESVSGAEAALAHVYGTAVRCDLGREQTRTLQATSQNFSEGFRSALTQPVTSPGLGYRRALAVLPVQSVADTPLQFLQRYDPQQR